MAENQIEQFMAAIRSIESGGRYDAKGPQTKYGRATGAYQFIDSTWGGYGGYKRAADAPPEVQDARARQLMLAYYRRFGRWDLVAVAWHGGPGLAAKAAKGQLGNASDGYMRTSDYANKALKLMGGKAPAGAAPAAAPQATPDAAVEQAPMEPQVNYHDLGVQYGHFVQAMQRLTAQSSAPQGVTL